MKIHKILSGIMTSVVMVASLSAGETQAQTWKQRALNGVRSVGNFAAKPFGYVWHNPIKTGVATVTVAGVGLTAYKLRPSMESVKTLAGKAFGCVPSRDSVKNFAGKVFNKMPSMSFVKALPGQAVALARANPKSSAAIFLGTAALAFWAYNESVKKSKSNRTNWDGPFCG